MDEHNPFEIRTRTTQEESQGLQTVEPCPAATVVPAVVVERPLAIPPSGAGRAWQETKHAVGILTAPVWWPTKWLVVDVATTTIKLVKTPLLVRDHALRWVAKGRADANRWGEMTDEEYIQARNHQALWVLLLFAMSSLTLSLPKPWNLVSLLVLGLAWKAKSHDSRLQRHYDLARQILHQPQGSEDQIRGLASSPATEVATQESK